MPLGLGVATLLIFAGMSTLVVDSMLSPRPPGRMDMFESKQVSKPIRRPTSSMTPAVPKPAGTAPAK